MKNYVAGTIGGIIGFVIAAAFYIFGALTGYALGRGERPAK